MIIRRVSPLTGKINEMDLDISEEQYAELRKSEKLIQHILPHLTAEEREFIISGCTPEDWKRMFG